MEPFSTGMQLRMQIFVVVLGFAMLLFILNLVRRRQLREQYSLLWILGASVLVLSDIFIDQVDQLANTIGIYYPPAFLFLIALVLVLVLQFHFSTVISNLREQNKSLTQDVGILNSELEQIRSRLRKGGSDPATDNVNRQS